MIACDTTVIDSSRCLTCFLPGQLEAAELLLLTALGGIDSSPSSLLRNAQCILSCTRGHQRNAIALYLLTLMAGSSTDPNTLLNNAKCFECLGNGQMQQSNAWLLLQRSISAGTAVDDNAALMERAKCLLNCLLPGQLSAVRVWLLTQLAAASTGDTTLLSADVSTLLNNARCLMCLTAGQMLSIATWLWCQIGNLGVAPDSFHGDTMASQFFNNSAGRLWIAQRYVASHNYTIGGVEASFTRQGSPTFLVTANLYSHDSANNQPLAQIGPASSTLNSATVSTPQFTEYAFSGMVSPVIGSTVYWLVFKASAFNSAADFLAILASTFTAAAHNIMISGDNGVTWIELTQTAKIDYDFV